MAMFLFGFTKINAQETTVRFKITNKKNEALSFATVVIFSVPDTNHKQTKIADSLGTASFIILQSHPYLVKVSSSSYKTEERKITITTERTRNYCCTPFSILAN